MTTASQNARPAIDPSMRNISSTAAIRKALRDGLTVIAAVYDEATGYRTLPVIDVQTSRGYPMVTTSEEGLLRVGMWYEASLGTQTYRVVDVYAGKSRKSS